MIHSGAKRAISRCQPHTPTHRGLQQRVKEVSGALPGPPEVGSARAGGGGRGEGGAEGARGAGTSGSKDRRDSGDLRLGDLFRSGGEDRMGAGGRAISTPTAMTGESSIDGARQLCPDSKNPAAELAPEPGQKDQVSSFDC